MLGLGAAILWVSWYRLQFRTTLFVVVLLVEAVAAALSAVVLVSLIWFSFVDCFSSCTMAAPSQYLQPAFFLFILTGTATAAALTTTVLDSGYHPPQIGRPAASAQCQSPLFARNLH